MRIIRPDEAHGYSDSSIWEGSKVSHPSYGPGTVTGRTYSYATVQFDAGYRKVLPADELTAEDDQA